MKFSIVTPVLNMAGTIRDCIESVARQAGDVEAIQHIIVDGGSEDGTSEVISEYSHIELIHEPSRGIYVAMNRGISAARYDVIGIVNADDLLEMHTLDTVSRELEANPQVEIIAGRGIVERICAGSRVVVREVPNRGYESRGWDLLFHGSTAINAHFFRRRVFEKHGLYNTDFAICADRELLIRFKLAGISTLRVAQVFYRYLEHEGSTTLNAERRNDMVMRNEHIAIAQNYLSSGNLSPMLVRRFHDWVAAERARTMIARLGGGDWRAAWREACMGIAVSRCGFVMFVLRRSLAAPTASLRRRLAWRRP